MQTAKPDQSHKRIYYEILLHCIWKCLRSVSCQFKEPYCKFKTLIVTIILKVIGYIPGEATLLFSSLPPSGGQLLKERICLSMNKFLSFISVNTLWKYSCKTKVAENIVVYLYTVLLHWT